MSNRPDWIKSCKVCSEPTGHKMYCCSIPICRMCDNRMNIQYQPHFKCLWCQSEVLPINVRLAKRNLPDLLMKLEKIQNEIQDTQKTIFEFERLSNIN